MSKVALKQKMIRTKGKRCSITNQILPEDTSLYDTHRTLHKKNNGTYTTGNTNLVMPIAHMQEHGTFRKRKVDFDTLKAMVDDRSQLMKLKNKINNQLLAYKRGTDFPRESTVSFLEEQLIPVKKQLSRQDREIEAHMKQMDNPLISAALSVVGVGPITIAHCLVYIDLEKARHASSLWSYTGLDKPAHARYEKGVAGGGNKTLRTILYTLAESQMKNKKAPYRIVYDQVKTRLEKSEKLVMSYGTDGKKKECMWKDTKPSHRHGAALRAIMKHFLADYWMVGRTLAGLPTSALYPEAMLGGTHRTIMPEERGWKY